MRQLNEYEKGCLIAAILGDVGGSMQQNRSLNTPQRREKGDKLLTWITARIKLQPSESEFMDTLLTLGLELIREEEAK